MSCENKFNEFFDAVNSPDLTGSEQFALFKKLQPEFSKQTGSNELFKIALLGGTLGYTIEERLLAYEKYSDLINSDRTDKVYLDLRKLIESDVE